MIDGFYPGFFDTPEGKAQFCSGLDATSPSSLLSNAAGKLRRKPAMGTNLAPPLLSTHSTLPPKVEPDDDAKPADDPKDS